MWCAVAEGDSEPGEGLRWWLEREDSALLLLLLLLLPTNLCPLLLPVLCAPSDGWVKVFSLAPNFALLLCLAV